MTENAVCDPHLTGYHSISQYTQDIKRFHRISLDFYRILQDITVYTGYYRIFTVYHSIVGKLALSLTALFVKIFNLSTYQFSEYLFPCEFDRDV